MKRIIAALVVMMLLVTAGVGVYATDIVDIIEIDEVTTDMVEVEEIEEIELIADDFELAAEMPVYFQQDFSTWTAAELADVTSITKGIGKISVGGTAGYKVINSLETDGALTMLAKGTNSEDRTYFTATDGISGKNAVIEFKLKKRTADLKSIAGADAQRNIYMGFDESSYYKVLAVAHDGSLAAADQISYGLGDTTLTQPTVDSNGYYNIKVEFYNGEYKSTKAWVIDFYDALTEEKFYSRYYATEKYPNGIKNIIFGTYRNMAARNGGVEMYHTIKDLKISEMPVKPDLYITDISHKGGNFEPGTKKLTLTFNKAVDTKTMDAGLSFTKADGGAIGGGVFYEFTSPNVLVIKFGRLPIGNYKLAIDEDLKNTDGGFAGEAEYVYNVTNAKDADYLVQDFSTWENADISETSKGIGTAVLGGSIGFKVPLTLNDDGSLTMQSKGVNATDTLDFLATDYIADQNAVTTFKLKSTTVDNVVKGVQRNIKLCIQGTTSSAETLRMNPDGSLMALNGSSIGSDAFTQPKKDDNGYFDIKINFYYGDFKGTEAWIAEFLDMNSNGQKFYGLYYAPTTFPHGLGGLGFGFYREKVDRDADTYVALTVKDLKIAQGGRRVFAISNDGEGAQPDAEAVTLIYDDTLPTDTFKEGNVKLLDGTTEIPITYEGDTVSRKLIVKPAEYLEYGKTYTIKVAAGDIVNTNFTTAKRPVTVTNAVLADGLVTVTLENVAEGESNVILGMFDAEGKVVGFKITPAAESVNFENIPENVTTIKVYATEKLDGYTRKACETVTYTIEDEA